MFRKYILKGHLSPSYKTFFMLSSAETKIIMLINVKMPKVVGILTQSLLAGSITGFGVLNLQFQYIWAILVFISSLNFMLS